MSITRSPRPPTGYYVLDNAIISDRRLSWAARGMLAFLLSKPDNWRVSVEHLRRETESAGKSTGRDGVYAILAELERAGYVKREQERGIDGKMRETEYNVSESPLPALPYTAEPYTANPTLVSTKEATSTERAKKHRGATAPSLPDWLPVDAWEDWHRFRNARQGWTAHARSLSLRKLETLYHEGHDPRSVIEQSIERGWTGLFPIRQDFQRQDRPSKQFQALQSILGIEANESYNSSRLVLDCDPHRSRSGVRPEFAGLPFLGDHQGDDGNVD